MYMRLIWSKLFISLYTVLMQVVQKPDSIKKGKKHLLNIYSIAIYSIKSFNISYLIYSHSRSERQILFIFSSMKKRELKKDVKDLGQDCITNEWQTLFKHEFLLQSDYSISITVGKIS